MLKATKQILSRSNSQICIVQILDYFSLHIFTSLRRKTKLVNYWPFFNIYTYCILHLYKDSMGDQLCFFLKTVKYSNIHNEKVKMANSFSLLRKALEPLKTCRALSLFPISLPI